MQSKKYRRALSALLALMLLITASTILPASAAGQSDTAPFRVISTFYGDSATTQGFHWATKSDCGSVVRVYEGDSALYRDYDGAKTTKFQGNYMHSAIVKGLKPGTEYRYEVGDRSANVWSETGYFTTNPGAGNAFSFIAIADVQASDTESFAYAANVFEAALENDPQAAFQAHLGDYTNNSSNEEWDMYFSSFKGMNTRLTHAAVAGNHDGNLKWNWFSNMFTLQKQANAVNLTGAYYSFDYGDAHFAVLNTNDMYPMSQQQRNWFVNDMQQSGAKWKIVLLHRGSYTTGKHITKPDSLMMRSVLLPLIEQCNIDLVLCGHEHVYYRSAPMKNDKRVNVAPAVTDLPDYTLQMAGGGKAFHYTDPGAPIHILPSAAGTKRYGIYEGLPATRAAAEEAFQPNAGVFASIAINGGELVYKAYVYDEATDSATLFDQVTVSKTTFAGAAPSYKPLPTDYLTTAPAHIFSFFYEILRVLFVELAIYLTKPTTRCILVI
ncbi:MAG: metallophosphoesterase family protein [Oscillospiraceae bacterium]|jgi:predicted phosphodiesterase|nr:metallophosphoesterase family protein [Oscillospiraceae bacterium]